MAHCVELLVDLPDYFRPVHGRDPTGFSDVMPAVKVQLGPLPGDVVFSATAGLGFPTGASRISGPGYNPYIQFPWSREIGGGWGLSGMFTQVWFTGQKSNAISEVTFVVEREVGRRGAGILPPPAAATIARHGRSFTSGPVLPRPVDPEQEEASGSSRPSIGLGPIRELG